MEYLKKKKIFHDRFFFIYFFLNQALNFTIMKYPSIN